MKSPERIDTSNRNISTKPEIAAEANRLGELCKTISKQSYYERLGVSIDANPEEIKKAIAENFPMISKFSPEGKPYHLRIKYSEIFLLYEVAIYNLLKDYPEESSRYFPKREREEILPAVVREAPKPKHERTKEEIVTAELENTARLGPLPFKETRDHLIKQGLITAEKANSLYRVRYWAFNLLTTAYKSGKEQFLKQVNLWIETGVLTMKDIDTYFKNRD